MRSRTSMRMPSSSMILQSFSSVVLALSLVLASGWGGGEGDMMYSTAMAMGCGSPPDSPAAPGVVGPAVARCGTVNAIWPHEHRRRSQCAGLRRQHVM